MSTRLTYRKTRNPASTNDPSKLNRDSEDKALFGKDLKEIKEIAGDKIESQIKQENIIIFVTSPNQVTPYHID